MADYELTVSELIRLIAPYNLRIITDGFHSMPDVTFEVCQGNVHAASRVSFEDLHKTSYMEYLIERMKRSIEREVDRIKRDSLPYKPVCPRGYLDCTRDPAYIKHNQPHLYLQLYGDVDPHEAVLQRDGCYEQLYRDPDEKGYCYDPEAT